jgi:ribonucleoside-diphosphate reductase alpha chain
MSALPSAYQSYIHLSRYARWRDDNRRETWEETVTRYCDFWKGRYPDLFPYERAKKAIMNLEVMPSMRALMTAGPALDRDEMAGYNCSFVPIDHPRAFDETLYILMCGTGVGFSVEKKFTEQLPIVPEIHSSESVLVAADSKVGWATICRQLVAMLYSGYAPKWDLTKIRPKGAPLRIFGGRASGPEPLNDMLAFIVNVFKGAQGRKLSPLECHDIVCKIADCVVVGGVRRSALISLSDLGDAQMRGAKSGVWWDDPSAGIVRHGQRALANNSAAYDGRPDIDTFMDEWTSLVHSKSGERGIFNRKSARLQAERTGRRSTAEWSYGTNPCGEIILRPNGLCNLTEVVVRMGDDRNSLHDKVELATILGTFQSTLTNFRYVRSNWRRNAEEERLLGVSLTGIMDNPKLRNVGDETRKLLEGMKAHAIEINATWAELLGINPSASITTVKPSGTVSQLVDSASGIHPRWSPFYLRSVRADKKDPLAQFMRANGFPVEDEAQRPNDMDVFYFPQEAPKGSPMRTSMSAIQQLEHYLMFKEAWCEHNPSITVYVRDDEWLGVGDWVYRNFDQVGGVSFLPHQDHVYQQAPYQDLSESEYKAWVKKIPADIDWTKLAEFEKEDRTTGSQELACLSGVCEIN